jgi:hypothetical protein
VDERLVSVPDSAVRGEEADEVDERPADRHLRGEPDAEPEDEERGQGHAGKPVQRVEEGVEHRVDGGVATEHEAPRHAQDRPEREPEEHLQGRDRHVEHERSRDDPLQEARADPGRSTREERVDPPEGDGELPQDQEGPHQPELREQQPDAVQ